MAWGKEDYIYEIMCQYENKIKTRLEFIRKIGIQKLASLIFNLKFKYFFFDFDKLLTAVMYIF